MAVYEQTYRPYAGELTAPRWRWTVLPRYVLRDVFQSKLLVGFFALALLVPLGYAIFVYVHHNADLLALLNIRLEEIFAIDETFFAVFLGTQARFAFFLALFIGPGLVARDLANNGLPLYLSRPISRTDYVVGKVSVLFLILSCVTWIPGLALYFLQGYLEGDGWLLGHLRIAAAIPIFSLLWILLLALLSLALSAWVKWRTVAAFLLFLVFVAGHAFAGVVELLYQSSWGHVANPSRLSRIVLASLLGEEPPAGPSLAVATLALVAMIGCCLFLLNRKLRAYEVVR